MQRTPHPAAVAALAARLTDRDRVLLQALHTHRVMTTTQVGRLLFSGPHARNARRRLLLLHRLHAIVRFRPLAATGSAPAHWVLAPAGAHVLAQHHGTTVKDLGYTYATAIGVAASSRLRHIVGLTGCYVAFAHAARTTPGAELQRWRGETESARRWGRYIRPDAYLRWKQNGVVLDAFLEYDNGTETLARVEDKIAGYADLASATGLPSRLLFVAPGHTRERNLARTLDAHHTAEVPIHLSTHALLDGPGPARTVWRGTRDDTRKRLADLAT
ncbi:replication-relaxation family protein [Nocardiopsis trehalosi]|uniref:replication-relaxation family protein n=1 Tax=Nocardiopsis trehalosi TaxID=109329 RepID=UPI0008357D01|nr:replication-relaxation family protein [Nocardiopsis trehalosi]